MRAYMRVCVWGGGGSRVSASVLVVSVTERVVVLACVTSLTECVSEWCVCVRYGVCVGGWCLCHSQCVSVCVCVRARV